MLNNPLKFTDQSGEFILIAALIGAAINMTVAAIQGKSFEKVLLAGVIGAATGIIAGGVGNLAAGGAFFGKAAMGVTGFMAGAGIGGVSGMAAGFAGGMMNAFANGGNFADALEADIKGGISGAFIGAAVGGISGGIKARKMGLDFWEAKTVVDAEKINYITQPAVDAYDVACNDCDDMGLFEVGDNWEEFKADLSASNDGHQLLKAYRKAYLLKIFHPAYEPKMSELFDYSTDWSKNGWKALESSKISWVKNFSFNGDQAKAWVAGYDIRNFRVNSIGYSPNGNSIRMLTGSGINGDFHSSITFTTNYASSKWMDRIKTLAW